MATIAIYTVFIGFLAAIQFQAGSSVRISINPDKIFESTKDPVSISCRPDINGTVVQKILVIEIIKSGGQPIAIARLNSKITYDKGAELRFKAHGQVIDNPKDSYLSLSLLTPTKHDRGTYTCLMYFMDQAGMVADERDSANLTVAKDDLSSLMSAVVKQRETLSVMENKLAGLITTLGILNQEFLSEKTNVAMLQQKMSLQESKTLPDLERKVVGLNEKVTCQSAFSATTTQSKRPRKGDLVQFPNVILKLGQGYNENTSIFTAPMEGLYAFNLVIEAGCTGCNLLIDLKANTDVVGTLKVGDYQYKDQSSISTVVKLDRSDKVRAVAQYTYGNRLDYTKSVLFNGFLIKCF